MIHTSRTHPRLPLCQLVCNSWLIYVHRRGAALYAVLLTPAAFVLTSIDCARTATVQCIRRTVHFLAGIRHTFCRVCSK